MKCTPSRQFPVRRNKLKTAAGWSGLIGFYFFSFVPPNTDHLRANLKAREINLALTWESKIVKNISLWPLFYPQPQPRGQWERWDRGVVQLSGDGGRGGDGDQRYGLLPHQCPAQPNGPQCSQEQTRILCNRLEVERDKPALKLTSNPVSFYRTWSILQDKWKNIVNFNWEKSQAK